MKKKYETMCGCHVADSAIVFCAFHSKTIAMGDVLDMLRTYFIDTTGEESPFVKEIDKLVPRRKS